MLFLFVRVNMSKLLEVKTSRPAGLFLAVKLRKR